ncbi:MAG TPA: diacylglycerol kinase family protein [Myxococcota bacterium]|nr:diacylglycerol kinase family protein [Myxococcota bacterium]
MSDFSLRARAQSFADAGRGIALLLAHEPNALLHAIATAAAIALGLWLGLSAGEWCWIVLVIALVWVAEGLNSAVEALADAVHPERDARVGMAKDLAAGAVLVAAIASVVIGALVFGPRLVARLSA